MDRVWVRLHGSEGTPGSTQTHKGNPTRSVPETTGDGRGTSPETIRTRLVVDNNSTKYLLFDTTVRVETEGTRVSKDTQRHDPHHPPSLVPRSDTKIRPRWLPRPRTLSFRGPVHEIRRTVCTGPGRTRVVSTVPCIERPTTTVRG